jgi:hypothetical protein
MAKLRPIWSHCPWLTFPETGALQDLPAESQDAEEHPLLGAELDHDPSRRPHYLPQLIHDPKLVTKLVARRDWEKYLTKKSGELIFMALMSVLRHAYIGFYVCMEKVLPSNEILCRERLLQFHICFCFIKCCILYFELDRIFRRNVKLYIIRHT